MNTLRIDICICTFRRPHIADTLRSIAKLSLNPHWQLGIIVADNDDTPSAQALVATIASETGLRVAYIHAPARNISIARNACLDVATAPLVAFIDDDEEVTPPWLVAMVAAVEKPGTDIVLGPVRALYGPQCPDWMRRGDFHSTLPVWVRGEIITGYSCNVLLRRTSPALQPLRFRPEFGRSGGEDTVFFSSAHKAGAHIAYAPEAVVTEAVPPERASLSWLLKRRFRSGQTHGLLLLETGGGMLARIRHIAVATAKAALCFTMTLATSLKPNDRNRMRFWLLRGAVHAGVISRLLGQHKIEQYGS